jgi:hypothetical protein
MCPGGRAVLVELKRRGRGLEKIQRHFMGIFTQMGFPAEKIDDLQAFRVLLTVSTQPVKLRSVARGAPSRRTE